MKMRRKNIGILILTAAMLFAGCGANSSEQNSESGSEVSEVSTTEEKSEMKEESAEVNEKSVAEKVEEIKTIGEKTEEAFEVKFENNTGKKITGFSVKLTEDETYPENMMTNGDVFADGEERILYYKQPDKEEVQTDTTQLDQTFEMNQGYNIELTFEDGTKAELHAFPFGDIEEGKILFDTNENIAYIEYDSVSTKEKVSTQEAEINTKKLAEQAAAEQAAAEQAAAQAAAEQAAAEQAAAEQAAAEQAAAQAAAEQAAAEQAAAEQAAAEQAAAQAAAEAAQQAAANQGNQSNNNANGCGDGFAFN
jgi:hypothetical protein